MTENDFIESFRKTYNIKHSIYIDNNTAKFLDEMGFSYQLHIGENYINETQAELLIPLLKGKIVSLKRKTHIKKLDGFLDYFISSYGPEFRNKWINNTTTALFCDGGN